MTTSETRKRQQSRQYTTRTLYQISAVVLKQVLFNIRVPLDYESCRESLITCIVVLYSKDRAPPNSLALLELYSFNTISYTLRSANPASLVLFA